MPNSKSGKRQHLTDVSSLWNTVAATVPRRIIFMRCKQLSYVPGESLQRDLETTKPRSVLVKKTSWPFSGRTSRPCLQCPVYNYIRSNSGPRPPSSGVHGKRFPAVVLVWYAAHVGVSSTIVVDTTAAPRLLPERLHSAVQRRAATSARSPGVFALSALLRTKRAQPPRWYHLASMSIIQTGIVANIQA